ncbi:hypothetical protein CAPTEDRAFT_198640 [Capitella teleta]|uniref:Methyltransferase FkbM domain-containing protein n=1 Tax=Capitella teleta TaxID=283909 RepID=R7T9I0_CAPTE|nr:hypothetical protein CAPTEDRAFT_198640 [Capitella teleta]|eukprot:ELT88065.1 hypothetical protein CAPTEDRAFT_198640 [Capitella teleta]
MEDKVTMLRIISKPRVILAVVISTLSFFIFLKSSLRDMPPPSTVHCEPPEVKTDDFVPANIHLSFLNNDYKGDTRTLQKYIRASIVGHAHRGYNLFGPGRFSFSQAGQDRTVDALLHRRRNGFFVECGAAEGETFSNTLFFERARNWDGLLIEANPNLFKKLLAKGRQAYSINACLSLSYAPKMSEFFLAGLLGGLSDGFTETQKTAVGFEGNKVDRVNVQCYPFNQIMAAMGRTHIDYFSLDVEGPEVAILKTINFEKLRIDVISIEYTMWNGKNTDVTASKKKLNDVREVMNATGLYDEHSISKIQTQDTGDLEADGLDTQSVRIFIRGMFQHSSQTAAIIDNCREGKWVEDDRLKLVLKMLDWRQIKQEGKTHWYQHLCDFKVLLRGAIASTGDDDDAYLSIPDLDFYKGSKTSIFVPETGVGLFLKRVVGSLALDDKEQTCV